MSLIQTDISDCLKLSEIVNQFRYFWNYYDWIDGIMVKNCFKWLNGLSAAFKFKLRIKGQRLSVLRDKKGNSIEAMFKIEHAVGCVFALINGAYKRGSCRTQT